jgi:hypothetical protein
MNELAKKTAQYGHTTFTEELMYPQESPPMSRIQFSPCVVCACVAEVAGCPYTSDKI